MDNTLTYIIIGLLVVIIILLIAASTERSSKCLILLKAIHSENDKIRKDAEEHNQAILEEVKIVHDKIIDL